MVTTPENLMLAAQLAFVRTERQAQRATPGAFLVRGSPTPRLQRLTALCDTIGTDLIAAVRGSDDYWRLTVREKWASIQVIEILTEYVARHGDGMPVTEFRYLEDNLCSAPGDWRIGTSRMVWHAERVVWPAVVPSAAVLGDVADVPA